ncbi:MAG: LssY C-terminal domain-containing protein [Candidatus Sulfotelmatobacter sp.]
MRLSTPASSFTAKRGTLVRGFLLESPQCDGIPVLPTRTPVEGRVLSVHRVGLGLWHETASLEIAFLRLLPAGADPIEINGRLKLVDNARETVRNGVIRGIRSTDTPQGTISSRLKYLPSIHLYPDPYLLGYKMLFPIFPDPEINLEAGTDIEVELAETAKLPDDLVPVSPIPLIEHDSELEHDLTDLPERTLTKKGKEADVVNIVFAGLRDDLEEAFTVAGWHQSGLTSTRSVTRQFYSFLSKSSYAAAPMSTQLLEGRKPDLALEKVFQSYEKRNHLRIWLLENTWEGFPLWASAAVRETGATLSFRQMGFIHHISENLNEEQDTIVRDLALAGCIDSVGMIARPMEHVLRNATGEYFRTDGSLEIIRVKPCESGATEPGGPSHVKNGSWAYRYLRREILTVRSDLVRSNCIYGLFDLARFATDAVRKRDSHRAVAAEFRQYGGVTQGK